MAADGLERAWCRNLGHLPRIISDHPRDPTLTRERCCRCGALIDRAKSDGAEIEVLQYRIGSDEVTIR